jgi:hypothetical protein
MTLLLTKADRDFLKSLGISSEPTFSETRLALAQRIAKHPAPAQVSVSPDSARLELVRLALTRLLAALDAEESSPTQNPTLEFLKANGLLLNRANYLAVGHLGNLPKELDAEAEAELRDTFEDQE